MTDSALSYLQAAQTILERIETTQLDAINQAAEICANTIGGGGLVHLFGTGHSRMFIEEMYPRHGSFPGFHPMVELSLTFHNPVVGSNGQRQAMFIEHVEGLGAVIMRNFVFAAPDSMIIFSNSGVNEVVVEVGMQAKQRDLPLIVVVSMAHCQASTPKHSSGKRLIDIADVTIDNGTPAGDALVKVEGLTDPVGPGSTIGAAAVTNAMKAAIAERLVAMGHTPKVLTSSVLVGPKESERKFNESYDEYRRQIRKIYGRDEA
jgi:uncharacterized phosphosugar-binding protein